MTSLTTPYKKIVNAVRAHLEHELHKRQFPEVLSLRTANHWNRWPKDSSREKFRIDARAVRNVWCVNGQYVCEGGSMSLLPSFTETLKAPNVHVPWVNLPTAHIFQTNELGPPTCFRRQRDASKHHLEICKTKITIAPIGKRRTMMSTRAIQDGSGTTTAEQQDSPLWKAIMLLRTHVPALKKNVEG